MSDWMCWCSFSVVSAALEFMSCSKKNVYFHCCCLPRPIGWEKRFPNDVRFKVPESLKKLVKDGKLGTKSGSGFYDYSKK